MRRTSLVLVLALVASLSAACAAHAVSVDVQPDGAGRLQAFVSGSTLGAFDAPAGPGAGMAGLNVGILTGTAPAGTVYGFAGVPFTHVSGPDESVAAGVTTTESVYDAGTDLRIMETIVYGNGGTDPTQDPVSIRYDIQNPVGVGGATPVRFRASVAADLRLGSDLGTGTFSTTGPNRAVGGRNDHFGAAARLIELSGSLWGGYEATDATTILARLSNPSGTGFTNFFDAVNVVDNAIGIQWDQFSGGPGVPDGGTPVRLTIGLGFLPFDAITFGEHTTQVSGQAGQPLGVGVSTFQGGLGAARKVCWSTTGVNAAGGQVVTNGAGNATIPLASPAQGQDTLTAFADLNGSGCGTPGASEPVRSLTVVWAPAPPAGPAAPAAPPGPAGPAPQADPVTPQQTAPRTIEDLPDPEPFREANLAPAAGEVFVKLPSGASPARHGLRAGASQTDAPKGFIPLTEAAQVPLKTIVDTTRGQARIETAADAGGRRTQTSLFYSGSFQITQPRSARPVTEMVLKGGSFRGCPSARGKGSAGTAASRGRRVRRLWGNGKGRFRTRGRYSSATVRGTTWLTEDRCNGTLTKVARTPRTNGVVVRDLVRNRSVTLRAGRSHFAAKRGK